MADQPAASIHVDWQGCAVWRQRIGVWLLWHATVTAGRILGARVTVEDKTDA